MQRPAAQRMRRMQRHEYEGVIMGNPGNQGNEEGKGDEKAMGAGNTAKLTSREAKAIAASDRNAQLTRNLMKPAFSASSTKPTTKKQRFSRKKLASKSPKGGLTAITVDPEKLAAYFESTKRDANRNTKYAIPVINNRLCR